ncbi:MAG: methyltransferase domain-containing protein [Planctomycetota bacterium]|nr:methyltransferase domain-containing protein [Planctomycetota bacterium]
MSRRLPPPPPEENRLEFPLEEGLTAKDVAILTEMRERYIARSEGGIHGPLDRSWLNARELALYDATFGARIGWKWRAVLAEVAQRAVEPPRGTILDWGCGTGVASRAWLERFGAEGQRVVLFDTSQAARRFAAQSLRARWPGLDVVEIESPPHKPVDVLLVSHVISELLDPAFDGLVDFAATSNFVAWVEPGSRDIAKKLVLARERLRDELAVLAPCTHSRMCGLLGAGRADDWCHHHGAPAPEAFTTRLWNQVAKDVGIDLRSLAYAFLVLGRGPVRAGDPRDGRILGRPRVEKGRALLDVCRAEGVATLRFLERTDKPFFRALGDAPMKPRLHRVEAAGDRIESLSEIPTPPAWVPTKRG